MFSYFGYGFLLAALTLPATLVGDVVFRCPSCTAERQEACPKLTTACLEIVREPGCGCCPVCARQKDELCGVYTPRCSGGLRCYPRAGSELPLEQLVQGLGQCVHKVDQEPTASQEHRETSAEALPTESPQLKKFPSPWLWSKENALLQHQHDLKTKMKSNRPEEPRSPGPPRARSQTACQQELDKVLEEISKMTFHDNRGPLENLYELKFPNCDKNGDYNLKQCHMSTHGQRGECWCVNPHTGLQIPSSPKVRGDPNCSQYLGGPELEPPTSMQI